MRFCTFNLPFMKNLPLMSTNERNTSFENKVSAYYKRAFCTTTIISHYNIFLCKTVTQVCVIGSLFLQLGKQKQ